MRVLGTMSIKQLIFDDLEEIVLPEDSLLDLTNSDVEAPQDPRFQIAKRMDELLTRAADARTIPVALKGLLTSVSHSSMCSRICA